MSVIDEYIEKFREKFSEEEERFIRKRFEVLGIDTKGALPNEYVLVYKGKQVTLAQMLRPCPCSEEGCGHRFQAQCFSAQSKDGYACSCCSDICT